jgi:hypothetical protein
MTDANRPEKVPSARWARDGNPGDLGTWYILDADDEPECCVVQLDDWEWQLWLAAPGGKWADLGVLRGPCEDVLIAAGQEWRKVFRREA